MDRSFIIAFNISLACHLVFLAVQFIQLPWRVPTVGRSPTLDIIYERREAEPELTRMQRGVEQLAGRSEAVPTPQAPTPQIRIPDRPIGQISQELLEGGTGSGPGLSALGGGPTPETSAESASRSAVVDLTNLAAAAKGDPVLLSYFSAIRERIQRSANQQTWLASRGAEGLIYVSFVLTRTGQVMTSSIVSQRSAPSRPLQEIALKIIRSAGPFPVFPPSLADASKTVVVPLEFLLGS